MAYGEQLCAYAQGIVLTSRRLNLNKGYVLLLIAILHCAIWYSSCSIGHVRGR